MIGTDAPRGGALIEERATWWPREDEMKDEQEQMEDAERVQAALLAAEDRFRADRRSIAADLVGPVVDRIVARTQAWADRRPAFPETPEPIPMTERGRAVQAVLDAMPKGMRNDLAPLAFAILGEPMPRPDPEVVVTYEKNTAVVVTANPNKHNYPLGQPVLVVSMDGDGDAHALFVHSSSEVKLGNYLPREREAARPATPEEIRTLMLDLLSSGNVRAQALRDILR